MKKRYKLVGIYVAFLILVVIVISRNISLVRQPPLNEVEVVSPVPVPCPTPRRIQ